MNRIEDRCIRNPKFGEALSRDVDISGVSLNKQCCDALLALEDWVLQQIQNNFVAANCDESVYVGGPGLAYMYIKASIYRCDQNFRQNAAQCLASWEHICCATEKNRSMSCSLLCGSAGWYCLDALLKHSNENLEGARNTAQSYVDLASVACSPELGSDEWLYGRAGYLHGLLLLQLVLGETVVPDTLLARVAEVILENGEGCAQRLGLDYPLMWTWLGKPYLGAAHGAAGILFMLLHVNTVVRSSCWLPKIAKTVDLLVAMATENTNWPSQHGDRYDHLVHFCHGAPGMVWLCCKAYSVLEDNKYLEQAIAAGETIWKYGLLKKGPGLCHGVAGNGYALLKLFSTTNDDKWLLRAHSFATMMFSKDLWPPSREPDHPMSLFEGLAGVACFLMDLRVAPMMSALPMFEVGGLSTPYASDINGLAASKDMVAKCIPESHTTFKGGKGDKGKGNGKKTVYADPEPASQPPPFPQPYSMYPDPYAAAMDPTMQMQMQQMYSMSLYAAQVQMGQQMAAYGAYAGAAAMAQMQDQMMQDQMPSEKGQVKKGKGKGKRPKGTKVDGTFTGRLKSINTKEGRGFGFIACVETMATYNRDVFVSADKVPEGAKVGDPFQFKVILNDKGQPQAANLKSIQ